MCKLNCTGLYDNCGLCSFRSDMNTLINIDILVYVVVILSFIINIFYE